MCKTKERKLQAYELNSKISAVFRISKTKLINKHLLNTLQTLNYSSYYDPIYFLYDWPLVVCLIFEEIISLLNKYTLNESYWENFIIYSPSSIPITYFNATLKIWLHYLWQLLQLRRLTAKFFKVGPFGPTPLKWVWQPPPLTFSFGFLNMITCNKPRSGALTTADFGSLYCSIVLIYEVV